jgi:hypothetical protein
MIAGIVIVAVALFAGGIALARSGHHASPVRLAPQGKLAADPPSAPRVASPRLPRLTVVLPPVRRHHRSPPAVVVPALPAPVIFHPAKRRAVKPAPAPSPSPSPPPAPTSTPPAPAPTYVPPPQPKPAAPPPQTFDNSGSFNSSG